MVSDSCRSLAPRFARSFTVSSDSDLSRIGASLEDGVLRLTLPRRGQAKPGHLGVAAN